MALHSLNSAMSKIFDLMDKSDWGSALEQIILIQGEMQMLNAQDQFIIDANYAVILLNTGNCTAGVKMLERLNQNRLGEPEIIYNLSVGYTMLHEYKKAVFLLSNAINQGVESSKLFKSLADSYLHLGEDEKAIRIYKKLLPEQASQKVILNLSLCSLRQKKYKEGWKYFEARPVNWNLTWLRPNWQYGVSIKSKNIVVVMDEGVGDVVMFMPLLKKMLRDVRSHVIFCDRRLYNLVKRSIPALNLECQVLNDSYKQSDAIIRLGSLAAIYWNDEKDIKAQSRYLIPDILKTIDAQKYLHHSKKKLSIGIAWSGAEHDEVEKKRREVDISKIIKDVDPSTVNWISIQHNANKEDIQSIEEKTGVAIHCLPGITTDLDYLASFIDALDLIITCEQTSAHFGGALGKETLVITGSPRGWRYINAEGKDHMLWYKSVKLISRDNMDVACQWVANKIKMLS